MTATKIRTLAVLLSLLYLAVNIITLPDYGLTWDFHFHFFAGANFLGYGWQDIEPRPLPYVYPDPRFTTDLPYGPLISILPVASFIVFYRWFHLLPYDVSYNLVSTVVGSLGPLFLYLFLREAMKDRWIPPVAALFLALLPRYFGDLHNNMKDIPVAVAFAVNVWLLWRLVSYHRPKDLFLALAGFAIAFATKMNALFIPPVFAAWIVLVYILKRQRSRERTLIRLSLLYLVLSPVAAFLYWSLFWPDPVGRIERMVLLFSAGTVGMQVLFNGQWFSSGVDVPWYFPYGYLAVTTPLPVLIFFLIGLFSIFVQFIRSILKRIANNHELITKLLLVLWFFVPLTRYLKQPLEIIDGIRHFEEVLFPLAAIAALGAVSVGHWWTGRHVVPQRLRHAVTVFVGAGVAFLLIVPIISYHPYQITFFNELVGGTRCAFGKWDLDYWGTSQKAAIEWLNANAPQGNSVTIAMAPDVAALYLRPDLLQNVIIDGYNQADYVVVLNRQAFFYRYGGLYPYILTHRPVYTVSVRDVPLTWVFDNRLGTFPPIDPWWESDARCISPPYQK